MKRVLLALASLALTGASDPPEWTRPTAPFRIAEHLYYVGTKGLAAYLIATPKGLILLDATLEQNVPAVEANIRTLGFKLSEVKILLNSHAHFDHAGGLAAMKRDTGAKLQAMSQDVRALQAGKHAGEQNYVGTFTPVHVDQVLRDGSTVTLGGVTLRAILTAGHTPGCTTWTMHVKRQSVMFPCSLTVAENRLIGNRTYPGIVGDYRASFKRLGAMDADIVLTAHPEFADVLARRNGPKNDRGLLPKIVAESKVAFDAELAKQRAAAK